MTLALYAMTIFLPAFLLSRFSRSSPGRLHAVLSASAAGRLLLCAVAEGPRSSRLQTTVHIALLAVSRAALPIAPSAAWKSGGDGNSSWLLPGLPAVDGYASDFCNMPRILR